jgi:hypothetical protein
MPTLKNKKSLQFTTQGHCKLDKADLRLKRNPACNCTYKKLATQLLKEALYFLSNSVVAGSFLLRNLQLLLAANLWA